MGQYLPYFKAYDVRAKVPSELNVDMAERIGRAYATFLKPESVVIGQDMRHSSAELSAALAKGLQRQGVNVIDIGLCGTEEVYFGTFQQKAGGGIMVTASHNPPEYNGMKFVREEARPLSGDNGLPDIERLAFENQFTDADTAGSYRSLENRPSYREYLMDYIDLKDLPPLKVVVNAGNGCASLVVDALEQYLPFEFIKIYHEPNGDFPHGVPNPLLPENRIPTTEAILEHKADLGIAWDGDFDRCFFFDEKGEFIEGYFIVGLLADALLKKNPGSAVVYDPRLTWNTIEMVEAAGGEAVISKAGHAFIKDTMRQANGIYGGEMSAHHYFRDFAYCDNGTIPWLLLTETLARGNQPLSELVASRQAAYPVSGEINRTVKDGSATLAKIEELYIGNAVRVDRTDGIGLEFDEWRFNLRKSNTEPLIRLNVESRANTALMEEKTAELLALIEADS